MTSVLSFPRRPEPFYLDVLLADGRLGGHTFEVDESRRIVDLMNSKDEVVLLSDAMFRDWSGAVLAEAAEWVIEKGAVVAVIPKETEEQKRHLRLERVGMARPTMARIEVAAVLGRFILHGTTYVPPSASLLRAHSDVFNRFFPLVDAQVLVPAGGRIEAEIVVVNRDLIGAIARLDTAQAAPAWQTKPPATGVKEATLESLVARIESEARAQAVDSKPAKQRGRRKRA